MRLSAERRLAWLYYGLLAAVMALRGRALPWRRWLRPAVLLTALSLLTLALWSAALHRPDGRLHIVALEDEAAVWVESAAGTRLAAGAPVNASTFGDALGRETGPFDRRLSALIATGVSAKTLQTLPAIVERLPVGQVAWLSPLPQSASARAFEQKLAETGVSGAYLPDGTNLVADAQLSLTVLAQNGLRLDAPQGCAYWPGRRLRRRMVLSSSVCCCWTLLNGSIRRGLAGTCPAVVLVSGPSAATAPNGTHRCPPPGVASAMAAVLQLAGSKKLIRRLSSAAASGSASAFSDETRWSPTAPKKQQIAAGTQPERRWTRSG